MEAVAIKTLTIPNIFKYATSELSQDAFLCWLFEHINLEDNCLTKQIANKITGMILSKYQLIEKKFSLTELDNIENYKVSITKQKDYIDIFLLFSSAVSDKKFAILIEDKTWSDESKENQVEEYVRKKKAEYPDVMIIPVYFKTGYVSPVIKENFDIKGIVTVDGRDIGQIFEKEGIDRSETILFSWWENFRVNFYDPIEEMLNREIKPTLSIKQTESILALEDPNKKHLEEIPFDIVNSYLFDNMDTFEMVRIKTGKRARTLYEYVYYRDSWSENNKGLNIGIYFTWDKSIKIDVKTIPNPYFPEKKMNPQNLLSYKEKQTVLRNINLPSGWIIKNNYLQVMKLEFKGINSINDLKLKLNQDIFYLANEIDRALENL